MLHRFARLYYLMLAVGLFVVPAPSQGLSITMFLEDFEAFQARYEGSIASHNILTTCPALLTISELLVR